MNDVAYAGASPDLPPPVAVTRAAAADAASRRWRTVWRTHFYAGVIAAPFMVMFALTGLVILYTQPIRQLVDGDLRRVSAGTEWISFEDQADRVRAAFPEQVITSVVTPMDATSSTEFGLDDGRNVFVDPYTGEVLGSRVGDVGIIGLSNRLHGNLNNDSVTVPLPSVAAIAGIGDGPVIEDHPLGDVLLEIVGGWAVILLASGVYLFWPRKRDVDARARRNRFLPRLDKPGRARWRDLHGTGGLLLSGLLLFTVVSGMPWASYWGANFTALANELTPNEWVDAPNSTVATRGSLDRLGNQINWNTGDAVVPPSAAPAGELPAQASLDVVMAAARAEGMKPNFSISYPEDGVDDVGNPTFGSFTLSNSWPRKTGETRTVYLDQFTGETVATMDVYGYGAVSKNVDTLVSTHMGTQLGLVSRIFMTVLCVLTLWSVASAVVMYAKRRRKGSLGLPRRPRDVRLAKRLAVITVVMGFCYPLWGASAAIVLALDRFVIRRVGPLRRAFGQDRRPAAA